MNKPIYTTRKNMFYSKTMAGMSRNVIYFVYGSMTVKGIKKENRPPGTILFSYDQIYILCYISVEKTRGYYLPSIDLRG